MIIQVWHNGVLIGGMNGDAPNLEAYAINNMVKLYANNYSIPEVVGIIDCLATSDMRIDENGNIIEVVSINGISANTPENLTNAVAAYRKKVQDDTNEKIRKDKEKADRDMQTYLDSLKK